MDVYLCRRYENDHPYYNKDKPEEFGISVDMDCTYEDFVKSLRDLIKKAESEKYLSPPKLVGKDKKGSDK